MLQECLKGVAFICITPMAKNIKISTYKRDFCRDFIFHSPQENSSSLLTSYIMKITHSYIQQILKGRYKMRKEEMYIQIGVAGNNGARS